MFTSTHVGPNDRTSARIVALAPALACVSGVPGAFAQLDLIYLVCSSLRQPHRFRHLHVFQPALREQAEEGGAYRHQIVPRVERPDILVQLSTRFGQRDACGR